MCKKFMACVMTFLLCVSFTTQPSLALEEATSYGIIARDNTTIDFNNKFVFTKKRLLKSVSEILSCANGTTATTNNDLSGFLGTGTIIFVKSNNSTIEYTLIVEGDINGDGVCDVLDAANAALIANQLKSPTSNQTYAANGCISDNFDVLSYQNVVNMVLYDETPSKDTSCQILATAGDTVTTNVDVYATHTAGEDFVDEEGNVVDGTVMVAVPKTVVLDGSTGTSSYVVKVKGNIAGNDIIAVVPDASVTMSQDGKDDVVATINQSVQRFAYKETTAIADATDLAKIVETEYSEVEGTIMANDITEGSWHGDFAFNISFATITA